jgi:hypothetical protein
VEGMIIMIKIAAAGIAAIVLAIILKKGKE